MIDPHNLPTKWTLKEIQEWILFGICVCNKPAVLTAAKVEAFLNEYPNDFMPFFKIKLAIQQRKLGKLLRKHRMGQYTRIEKALRQVIELNLDKLSVEMLESVTGIGPKTARMIMLYYKPNLEIVPLDTHILKYLGNLGYKVPKSTPSAGATYNKLERVFVDLARQANKTVKQLDTEVWQSYAR